MLVGRCSSQLSSHKLQAKSKKSQAPSVPLFSYFTALAIVTYAVLPKENHMQLTEAATLDRKSGEAEGSAVPRTFPGNVFDGSASAVEGPTVSSPRLMKYRLQRREAERFGERCDFDRAGEQPGRGADLQAQYRIAAQGQ